MNKFAIIGCSATKDPTQSTAEKPYFAESIANGISFGLLMQKHWLKNNTKSEVKK